MPEDETLTVFVLNRKEIQLLSESAMVALFRFLTLTNPIFELLLSRECGAVDALHLILLGIAFPICARESQKFESLDLPGVRHMRTEAEVDERRVVYVVDARGAVDLLVDQFTLERFLTLLEDLEDLRLVDVLAAIGKISLHHLPHFFLDDR